MQPYSLVLQLGKIKSFKTSEICQLTKATKFEQKPSY